MNFDNDGTLTYLIYKNDGLSVPEKSNFTTRVKQTKTKQQFREG